MIIDWFTVSAQALNFVILMWLMKHFLYQQILDAIDAREKRVTAELADADTKKAEAKEERAEFRHRNEQLELQRAALLRQATDEAKAERQRLVDEAREAAEVLSAKRLDTMRNDAREMSQALGRQTREEVFAIARKALTDLAAASLEERMCDVFTRRLREMEGQGKARLGAALKTASDPALVRSAFALPTPQRAAIQNALNETFSAEVHIRFETAPDLIGGIELTTTGQKVAWSIDDYLGSLEKRVAALVSKPAQAARSIRPQPAPVLKGGANGHST